MQRAVLGVVSLALIVWGVLDMVWWDTAGAGTTGGVLLRAGLVLGAIWLALPGLRRVPRHLLIWGAGVAALLVVRPRLLLIGLPAAIVLAVLTGPRRSRPGSSGQEPPRGG